MRKEMSDRHEGAGVRQREPVGSVLAGRGAELRLCLEWAQRRRTRAAGLALGS